MYKQIYAKLSQAKKSGQRSEIKKAFLFLVFELEAILNFPKGVLKNTLPFSDFIKDSGFIFGVKDQSVFNREGADVNISTEGLVVELSNIYGISDGKKIENDLKNTIFTLHSNLSRGVLENKLEIDKLRFILEDIKNRFS